MSIKPVIDKILEDCKDLPVEEQRKIVLREMMVDDYGNAVPESLLNIAAFNRVTYKMPTNLVETRRVAELLYNNSPLVKWFVNMTTSFVVGGGFEVKTGDNPIITALANRFIELNDIHYMIKKFYRADMLHGEGFYRLWIVQKDGQKAGARKGDIILRRLATGLVNIDFNPSDPQDVNYYYISYFNPVEKVTVTERILPYDKFIGLNKVSGDSIVSKSPAGRRMTVQSGNSCIIHFKMNDLPNELHGISEISSVMEWAEMYAEHLRTGLLQTKLRGGGAYDITIEEENEELFTTKAAVYNNWTIGDNFVHNQGAKVQTLEFASPVDGFEEIRRALLLMFITGTQLSEHYTGDSKSGSRAQGQSMELPQMKCLEDKQEDYEWLWRNILRTAIIIQTVNNLVGDFIKGKLDSESIQNVLNDRELFGLDFPSVSSRDRTRLIENLKKERELGTVSVQTTCSELGRDYSYEMKAIEEHDKKYGVSEEETVEKEVKTETKTEPDGELVKREDGSAEPMDRRESKEVA